MAFLKTILVFIAMYYLLKMVFAPKKSNPMPPRDGNSHIPKSNFKKTTAPQKDIEGDYVEYEEVKD